MIDGFIVTPKSKNGIDEIVGSIREKADCEYGSFDIVRYLDSYEEPILAVKNEREWIRKRWSNMEAFLSPNDNTIWVRENIYLSAADGDHRARFTLAHEFGHYIMHREQPAITRYRDIPCREIFRDSEWQANYFAGSLLAPTDQILNMNIKDITRIYGISRKAAQVRIHQSR